MTTFTTSNENKYRTTEDLTQAERDEIERIFEYEPETPLVDIAKRFRLSMMGVTRLVVRKIIKGKEEKSDTEGVKERDSGGS